MNSINRIIELQSEMLTEKRNIVREQKETNQRLENVEYKVEKLEEQQAKTNLGIVN